MVEVEARSVVWDFDGTIFNSFVLWEEAIAELLQRHDIQVPGHSELVHNYHGRLRDSIQGVSGADGALLEEMCNEFIRDEEHHYEHPEGLYFPDALALLRRCHELGLPQVIVSNRTHHSDDRLGSPRNLAKREPLVGLVDAVVCGDDNDFYKPDARLLNAVDKELRLEPSRTVVIGDQLVDAELAYNLGARAVLVVRGSDEIPHLDRLPGGWQEYVQIVHSLNDVAVTL